MPSLMRLIQTSVAILALCSKAHATTVIYDDFSQPNYDTGSHTPFNVYATRIWDGTSGGGGLSPNNGTTPGHTVLGTNLPGGVWQLGGGAGADYDSIEVGNLAGYGASNITLTGGSTDVTYASVHNNENVALSLSGYTSATQLTVSVDVCPQSADAYVGFDSTLNVANNFSGLRLDQSGGLSLFVNGSQIGSAIAFTGTWSQTSARLLTFTVNTSTGSISGITLQGSTSSYSFSSSAFTSSTVPYIAFFTPSGGGYCVFAYLTVSSNPLVSPPAAPTGLTATGGNTQVALSWTASSGATGYNIYRGLSSGGESATAIATGVTSTSYMNTGLTNGTTYYYKVTATNSGGSSGYSNEASATPTASSSTVIYDDFSQPNYDTGSHTPFNVYGTRIWDGGSGGGGLPPNNGTTPGHTVLGTDLPGGVWQLGGGSGADYDCIEVGNLAGYGASNITLTGGSTDVPYASVHNNENVAISMNGYHTSNQVAVSVNVCPQSSDAYVGFDSALNVANNFSGLRLDQTGGLSLFVNGTQVGSAIAFTGTWSQTSARLLKFTVNTSTGAISSISLQGSASSYSFSTSAFTSSATPYLAFFTPAGTGSCQFAYLTVSATSGGGGSAPAAPTSLAAIAGNAQIALTWTASSGATSYNVYRGTSSGGESTTAIATGVTSTSYTNTGLSNGTTCYYKVTATNSYGTSGYSNEASATPTSGTGVTAVAANSFLNTIGVCTHIAQGLDNESNVATCMTYAGIRVFRDDGTTNSSTITNWINLHNATGVRGCILPIVGDVASSTSMYDQLANAGALLAAEGPNEPNNEPVTYMGQTSGYTTTFLPVADFQRDLYTAVKADSHLSGIPVFASSEAGGSEPDNVGLQFLTIPSGAGTTMPAGTQYADYANTHNYILGNGLSAPVDNTSWNAEDPTLNSNWDGMYVEYGHTWHGGFSGYTNTQLPSVPRVTTETGWYTTADSGIGETTPVSLDQQGKLFLNLYLAAMKRGWSYTFVYYLHDTSAQGYWGFFDTSYNAKPSGTYLHNMTTILADTTNFTPGALNYSIASEPSTVHDLLIEKSNGTYYLAVWDDRPVGEGSDTVTVNLGGTYAVNQYDPTVGTSATNLGSVSSVTLTLTDHPIILAIP